MVSEPAVDAPRVGLAHRLGVGLQRRIVGLGDRSEPQPAEEGILAGPGHPDHFGPAPQRPPTVPLHLPDPVVGRHPALRCERRIGRRGLDVGDPPLIPPDGRAERAGGAAV